jgi:hypothetical protein
MKRWIRASMPGPACFQQKAWFFAGARSLKAPPPAAAEHIRSAWTLARSRATPDTAAHGLRLTLVGLQKIIDFGKHTDCFVLVSRVMTRA